ncbi:hypothetical protein [Pseudomonas bohemica]|uniref:hypothetical protein n=1 Tax=Pseudomonas bohemica TaxID=2044872 RepID=UPI0018FE39B1|nr:hypothetical protein [Pseudomonas bohemica]
MAHNNKKGFAMNWYSETTIVEKSTFWSSYAGWAPDSVDTQLFSLLTPCLSLTWALVDAAANLAQNSPATVEWPTRDRAKLRSH